MQNGVNKISYEYRVFTERNGKRWHLQQESFDCIFYPGERNILRVPQVPLLPSSGSKANVGCYEYHFLMKGIDKSCFLVVQWYLQEKKCMKGTDPKLILFLAINDFIDESFVGKGMRGSRSTAGNYSFNNFNTF